MQIKARSSVIGVIPRPETRGTGRRRADREVFGEAFEPANDNLIEQTRRLWRSRLGRDVSCEDARQIAENVTGFFSILAEWSGAEIPSPANDTGKPIASDNKEADHDR